MAQLATTKSFAARPSKLFTIGQVLDQLVPDFPDLTPSKLRFLEEQGLVLPERTPAGYRKFTDMHIERVRIVLELQRDQYLPLKVIYSYLSELDEGRQPSLPGATGPKPEHIKQARLKKFSEIELIAETGITTGLLAEAREVSLLTSEPFDVSAVEIAKSIVNLQRFGISPRHLRGIKASADREIGIIEGVVAPVLKKNDTSAKSRAAHYALEIEAQFSAIRSELVKSVIARIDS